MFLATTALTEFWKTDQDVLFLGHGCLRYDQKSDWSNLNYQVLENPWDDKERFYEAVRYLDESYDRLLQRITQHLEHVHQTSLGERYWRIILGPWLMIYLHSMHDRYTCLKDALALEPNFDTYVMHRQSFKVPQDIDQMVNATCDDAFNLQLYSQIFTSLGHSFPALPLSQEWAGTPFSQPQNSGDWKQKTARLKGLGIRTTERVLSTIVSKFRRTALCDMYIAPNFTWQLAWRSAFRASPFQLMRSWPFLMPEASFDDARTGLGDIAADDEFERVVLESLPHTFPVLYLEGFPAARESTIKRYRKTPAVIASLNGWHYDEPFKFLAAEALHRGGRLVAGQHGGNYGVLRSGPSEKHERSISDTFLVWGWSDSLSGPDRNISSPVLSISLKKTNQGKKTKRGLQPSPKRDVLFVADIMPRYLIRFDSMPMGTQIEEYLEWQSRFFRECPASIRGNVVFRPHKGDFNWSVMERTIGQFPDLHRDYGSSINRRFGESKLVVIDNAITTFLETLAANIPTILFWNPDRWGVRDEAQPYFDALRNAEILFDTPESAAAKLIEVYDDVESWWENPQLQESRQTFADRFCAVDENWMKRWADALDEEYQVATGATLAVE